MTPFPSVSVVDLEQVNVSWRRGASVNSGLQIYRKFLYQSTFLNINSHNKLQNFSTQRV